MKVLIGTHNPGKIQEFKALLNPYHIEVLTVSDFPVQTIEVEETGCSYLENATIKARNILKFTFRLFPMIRDWK